MEYLLGIDIGTGSTKAVAVSTAGVTLDSSQRFYTTDHTRNGQSEQDPKQIWTAFLACVNELTGRMEGQPAAISLSSAMHSVIPADEHGEALAPMLTWADSRGSTIAGELLSGPLGASLYRETGTPIHSMSPLCKISWIGRHQPSLFSRTFKFISIKEYIWYRLFGVFEIDHSIASCTGLMDVRELKWSENALRFAGLQEGQLSRLVSTHFSRTQVTEGLFPALHSNVPFVIGASDGCLANLGTGAVLPGTGALTIGTSGALRMAGRQALSNETAMTFSYRLDEETFINGGPVSNGGIALKWHLMNRLQRNILHAEDFSTALKEMEAVPPGAEGLLFLPYLQGERAPIWDNKSCGTFFGIRLNHGPAHFTRAVIEGICYALNDVLLALQAAGQQPARLMVSGGFITSAAWLQLLSDITGKTLVVSAVADASATGAAYLAYKAIGLGPDYLSPPPGDQQLIQPDAAAHLYYQRNFLRYKALYQRLKALMEETYDDQHQSDPEGY